MSRRKRTQPKRITERGATLVIVAAAMVGLLGVCAIAIDLAGYYLARAEAQRAADAAALAGASAFVNTGCATSGCTSGGMQEPLARQQAEAVGNANSIAGVSASIQDDDIAFSYPSPQEPQITVTAGRSVPTYFAKVFGIRTSNVRASATAEAYNASGGSVPVSAACLKPFLIPNCDPIHTSPRNPTCQGSAAQGYIIDPNTGAVVHPDAYPSGVIGMPWKLHSIAGASQWYLVGFQGAPPSSGSALRNHIVQCTPAILSCGSTLTTANGNNAGPVLQGTEALINANGDGLNQGQDSIDTSVGPPFYILGGSNNPNPALVGKTFRDLGASPSVVNVPIYNGSSLPPGGTTVFIGYMQVFIKDAIHSGNSADIDAVILNIGGCGGSGGAAGSASIVAAGGSPIPIRLIRTD
ncbi:MAG TPA: pilus assembly protein TadG-related protein [Terriglobia bacterium]|nr:pilus assembly protein TadG-related protein [Terriglobia bacterium]